MKSLISVAVAMSAIVGQASCHYIFQQLTHSSTKFPVYQYIRKNYNYNSPVTDLKSLDMRCNAGGETGNDTQTITMAAGDPFTFTTDTTVYHNGPLSIYMAKAPAGTAAVDFTGAGQVWFKILDMGPTFSGGQITWPLSDTYTYKIPKNLPSGDYLLRMQQLGIHNPYPAGTPQFYIGCAQVTVTGGGTGTPAPLVSIPGWISGTEPGYTCNIYNGLTNYTVPGPPVWVDAPGSGSSSPAPETTAVEVVATTLTSAIDVQFTTLAQPTIVPVFTTASAVKVPTTTSKSAAATGGANSGSTGSTGAAVAKYGQCGGQEWKGSTVCVSGTTCKAMGSYYSQCT